MPNLVGTQDIQAIEFENEMKKLKSPRHPHDIVDVGDSVLRAVICEGDGKWYIHDYDEFFLYYKGDVIVESDNSRWELKPGTGVLVPYSWFSSISRLAVFWHD